jgi:hypothetical protein
MSDDADSDLSIPELGADWFESAVHPNHRVLRRGTKRAVFVDDAVANRFESDEELEAALRALLSAADHVQKTG